MGTLHEDQYASFILFRPFLLRMRNISDDFVENIRTCILDSRTFSRKSCRLIWKNIVQPDRPQMKIRRMRIASWVPYATNTHSESVIIMTF
jgi:hypothetical protein